MIFFDQGQTPPVVRQLLRQRVPGLAGADHDGIVTLHRQDSFPSLLSEFNIYWKANG